MYICSSYIERCDSIDLTLIFRANTVATAKHRETPRFLWLCSHRDHGDAW